MTAKFKHHRTFLRSRPIYFQAVVLDADEVVPAPKNDLIIHKYSYIHWLMAQDKRTSPLCIG